MIKNNLNIVNILKICVVLCGIVVGSILVTDYVDKFAIYSASIDIRKAGH